MPYVQAAILNLPCPYLTILLPYCLSTVKVCMGCSSTLFRVSGIGKPLLLSWISTVWLFVYLSVLCVCVHAFQGIAELKESAADESLVISWRQTQRQRSGLSCMAVHPSHWTISIDALPSEDERTEVCDVLYL